MVENDPKVAILLASYNGSRFIDEQIYSIINQTYKNWVLYCSDDCSTDDTYDKLKKFALKHPNKIIVSKNKTNKGFCKNFMDLFYDKEIEADYFAFSDQDDVWDSKKIEKAIFKLEKFKRNELSLYCCRRKNVDEEGNIINTTLSYDNKCLEFKNAIVQSVAGGNTMVLNESFRYFILKNIILDKAFAHDWLIYILVTAFKGNMYYDNDSYINYKEHSNNLIGSNSNFLSKIKRLIKVFAGDYKNWNDLNLEIMGKVRHLIPLNNRKVLDFFILSRSNKNAIKRIIFLKKSGIYRQSFIENILLYIACLFNKI